MRYLEKLSIQELRQIRNSEEYKYAKYVLDKLIKDNDSSWKKCKVTGKLTDLNKASKYVISSKVASAIAKDLDVEGYKFLIFDGLQPNGYGYSFFTLEW